MKGTVFVTPRGLAEKFGIFDVGNWFHQSSTINGRNDAYHNATVVTLLSFHAVRYWWAVKVAKVYVYLALQGQAQF